MEMDELLEMDELQFDHTLIDTLTPTHMEWDSLKKGEVIVGRGKRGKSRQAHVGTIRHKLD